MGNVPKLLNRGNVAPATRYTQNHESSVDGAGLSTYSLLAPLNPMQCINNLFNSVLISILASRKHFRMY